MDHIETKILNSYTIQEAAQNMVFAARLTQQGHSIQNMDDLMALYQKSFTDKTVDRIASLPHPTVQKFTVITVAIVGASRRFLAQITRHQNEVKFMSASLQYSNYSEKAAFAIPYEILFSEQRYIDLYLKSCLSDLRCYQELCSVGFHHDSAGYALPHALRNILIICATPYEWKHMISQRICRRNTDLLYSLFLLIFSDVHKHLKSMPPLPSCISNSLFRLSYSLTFVKNFFNLFSTSFSAVRPLSFRQTFVCLKRQLIKNIIISCVCQLLFYSFFRSNS